jgi:hypothetical protein
MAIHIGENPFMDCPMDMGTRDLLRVQLTKVSLKMGWRMVMVLPTTMMGILFSKECGKVANLSHERK